MGFKYDYVLNLGPDCQAATQAKKFFPRAQCVTIPLTFQVTPFETMIAYLENDFRGFFEYDDLAFDRGVAVNRKYMTIHPHEFPDGIASYPIARSRHDYLCNKARSLLNQSDKGLLLLFGSDRPDQAGIMENVIRVHYPKASFRLVAARSHTPSTEWADRRLSEWQQASADAKRKWGRTGLLFNLKMQSHRLAHHVKAMRA